MNERRNLRFHLLRLTNLETENGQAVKQTHVPVLANLGTPHEVLREKNFLHKNVRSLTNFLFRPLSGNLMECCYVV